MPAEPSERSEPERAGRSTVDLDKAPPPAASSEGEDREPRGRPVAVLLALLALLLALGAGEVLYLTSADDEGGPSEPSAERPVQVSDLTVQSVVDQAATAAVAILSASSTDYDAQVEEATATMTDPFAEEYRATKDDVKADFLAADTEVTVEVSAQGVVSATEEEVQALLFLTQTTRKGTQGGVTPVQYRVTVTMVDTPDGWLVSDLQAL